MKILVTYRSVTGNTKKIADAIFGEIDADKEIKNIRDVESLDGYDFIFVGCPIEGYGPAKVSRKWMKDHLNGKRIGLFCTHGAPEMAPTLPPWLDQVKGAANDAGAEVVTFFNCQGEMGQRVLEMLLNSDKEEERQMGAFGRDMTIGQPDESRVEKAREFARETMKAI
jgi:flavodoxin